MFFIKKYRVFNITDWNKGGYIWSYFKLHKLIILFLTTSLHANQPDLGFKQVTVEDGLSQSFVLCIEQDRYGFIWLGTDDGLNRYDGYDVIQYKYNTSDKNSISHSTISSICEDNQGNLWIGTFNGLNLYDRSKNIFLRDTNWPQITVRSIAEDSNSNLWIATVANLYCYNHRLKSTKTYEPLNDASGNGQYNKGHISSGYLTKVFVDKENNIWIGSNNGLNLYIRKSNSFINIYHKNNDPSSLGDNMINAIYEDHLGRIWIGHTGGLDLMITKDIEKGNFRFRHYVHDQNNSKSISKGSVNAIVEDDENRLWVGIDNGGVNVIEIDTRNELTGLFYHYYRNPNVQGTLSNNSIFSLYKDSQKNIWVGTYGNGANVHTPFINNFRLYRNDPLNKYSLSNNQVNVFLEDSVNIWIGTEGGLNRYDKNTELFYCYAHNPNDNSSIGSNAVWALAKDKQDNLWIGTWAGGLNKMNIKTGKFIRYLNNPSDTNSISSNNIFAIHIDKDENLWLGTMGGGLGMLDRKTNRFINYQINNSAITSNYVESIVEDDDNNLWMANLFSVQRFNRDSKTFKMYIHSSADSLSLSGSKVYVVFRDSKSTIWVGTDVGINRYIAENDNFKSFQVQDGLCDNSVKSIIEDREGNLWLGTNKGISKLLNTISYPRKPEFKNYYKEDGLQSNEFNRRSCLLASNGQIYFGGENGFNVFNPREIHVNNYLPYIVFTDFLLFNEPIEIGTTSSPLNENICEAKTITLTHSQSVFTIKYVAINYNNPSKNEYAYILEGFEKKWNYVGNKREATYTNLGPGSYTFRVKACNNDRVWNEKGISIELIILPAWWQTMWFRIFTLMFLLSSMIGFYLYRVNSLNLQKIELQRLVLERTHEINEKNIALVKQTDELNETNTLLEEKNQFIEEQNELLLSQTEKLNETNALLEERQQLVEEQAEELQTTADELKEKNSTLERLNATKDKFFTIIAHDLKNPFNAILGFSELLITNFHKYDDTKKTNLIRQIFDSSNKVYKLLENLLQWSRSQTGSIEFKPELFNLNDIIEINCTLVDNMANEKNLKIIRNCPKEVYVFADKNMLSTVIRNLLTNAIKFSEKGNIIIECLHEETNIRVKVVDTGVGINPEKIEDIFDITSSKSTEGTRGESGTGLGLILCKEFVEKNQGTIGVVSEVSIGSTFFFTIPAAPK